MLPKILANSNHASKGLELVLKKLEKQGIRLRKLERRAALLIIVSVAIIALPLFWAIFFYILDNT